MVDFLFDEDGKDILLVNNRVVLNKDPKTLLKQKILITLRTFRGEWFENILFGIPYLKNENNVQQILSKGGARIADMEIKRAILETEGVVSVIDYSSQYDRKTRALSISFTAFGENGEKIQLENIEL